MLKLESEASPPGAVWIGGQINVAKNINDKNKRFSSLDCAREEPIRLDAVVSLGGNSP